MSYALPREPQALAEDQDRPATVEQNDQHLTWLLEATRSRDGYRYLLVLKFALVNLFGIGLLMAAALQGYAALVLSSDRTNLSVAIFCVFLVGLTLCGWKVFQTSRDLNRSHDFDPLTDSRAARYLAQVRGRNAESRAIAAAALRLKLSNRIGIVRQIANWLVLLGLIGTVIGFIIALSGVEPDRASDVNAIAPMVSRLIEGMSVALYTTLVGAILNLWLTVNYHILTGGTVKLLGGLIALGEAHARHRPV